MNNTLPLQAVRFTVVIPVYNGRATIVRTIQSVLAQSYTNYEVIVVDDRSTDDTVSLVESEFGTMIKLIAGKENRGSSAARNAGIDAATGNYIAFLDADDTWHKDKLMLMKLALEANPKISLLFHTYTVEDISAMSLPANLEVYKVGFRKLLKGNFISTSCLVIKNEASFRFEPTMRYTEDFDLALRIGYNRGIYLVNITLTQISRAITSAGGISENKWAMRKGEMRAYIRLARLNPLFVVLIPFLLMYSLCKHLYKMVLKP